MSLFKEGEKVRVRIDADTTDWSEDMIDLKGKIVTIYRVNESYDECYIKEIPENDGYFYKEELVSLKGIEEFNDEDFDL